MDKKISGKNVCAVIGANGYIGSHLTLYLKQKGYDVFTFDIQKTSSEEKYETFNVTDKQEFKKLPSDVCKIFYLSGLSGTHKSFSLFKDYVEVNELGLANLLDYYAESEHKPQIIFPSSRLIYKGSENPLVEDAAKEAKTIYAVNKLAGEYLLQAYNNRFGIPYLVFRICLPFGNEISSAYSYGTIGFFLSKAKAGENITLFGDGNLKRTFSYIKDVCLQMILASENEACSNQIFNIGGETHSLAEVANLIAEKHNVNIEYIPWQENDLKLESGDTVFDSSKLEAIIGKKYSINIYDWISKL